MGSPERERVPQRETVISIMSMFGLFSKTGSVKLELVACDDTGAIVGRMHVLLDPDEARRQAMYLIEAAGSAERDAAFWKVANELGMTEEQAGRFLQACREAANPGA